VHVPLRVQQHVLGLEVAVHDVDGVQVPQRAHQLCRKEAHHGLGEDAEALEVKEELPAAAVEGEGEWVGEGWCGCARGE
jgi:hypothetical protein